MSLNRAAVLRLKLLTLFCALLAAPIAFAQGDGPPRLFADFSLYPYQRSVKDDVDFTTTINARLPGRFSYFGYMNFKGVVTGGSAVFDRSEQNLRYSLSDRLPLDLNAQGILARGDGNDFYQLGVSWRIHDTPGLNNFFDRINMVYRMTFQLKRYGVDDASAWAMEHWFRITFPQWSDRLYVSGFVDQTFDQDLPEALPKSPIVGEVQMGVRLWDNFYAISEYRVNQRRVGDEYNFAVGLEYKVRW